MAVTDLKRILENNQVFSGLSLLEREKLPNIANRLNLEENQVVIPRRIIRDSLFMVCRGDVRVENESGKQEKIQQLIAGDVWFGGEHTTEKMADKVCVSGSPKAIIMVIRLSDLFYQVDFRRIHSKICQNLGIKGNAPENKNSSQHHYLWLFNQAELEQRVLGMQNFITTIILLLCMYIFFLHVDEFYVQNQIATVSVTSLFTLISLFAFGIMLKKSHFPPAVVGLTLTNTRVALKEALLAVVPLFFITVFLKWILLLTVPAFSTIPLLAFQSTIPQVERPGEYFYTAIIYICLSIPLQELVFRGGIQGFLQQLFAGKKTMWQPICIANIVFSTTNMTISPLAAAICFFPGFYWGWLFARHNNLIGVCLSHAIFATTTYFVLGVL